jgi:hypothetical protein
LKSNPKTARCRNQQEIDVSNYVQSTNFATKDALPSGDPLKIVKGTEINTEFNNISVAIATKADLISPTFTGTPVLPTGTTGVTQSAGNNTTALATTAFVQAADSAAITAERTATATLTNKSLTSPTLTGTPVAPTASVNTNTTQVATTAFVVAQIADDAPTKTGTGASGTWGIDITGNAATATNVTNALGAGQTWQDVLASRSAGTSYQNTTGLPIAVNLGANASTTARLAQISTDDVNWLSVGNIGTSGAVVTSCSFVVPDNVYYRVSGSTSLNIWAELR